MKELAKKVKLQDFVDVDNVAISKDHYFSNAYVVDLPLQAVPDHAWQDILDREWKSTRTLWDRKLFVIGDKLRLVTTLEDIEAKFEWVKQVIEQTNKAIDEYNREAEARETQLEDEKRTRVLEEEEAGIDSIRDTLRKRFTTF
jgi:hypothetical protein